MKKVLTMLVITFGLGIIATAQDVITLKNGTDINALVQEIGYVDVKYKKFDNPNGPNYTLKKVEILIIRYANGSKDIFSNEEKPVDNNGDISFTSTNFVLKKNAKILIRPYTLRLQTKKMCNSLEQKFKELGFCCIRRKIDEHDTDSSIDIVVHPAGPSSFRFHIYDKTLDREVFDKKYLYRKSIKNTINYFIKDITRFIEE